MKICNNIFIKKAYSLIIATICLLFCLVHFQASAQEQEFTKPRTLEGVMEQ